MRKARRSLYLTLVAISVTSVLSIPSASARSGHYERPRAARIDLMHFTWSSTWRYHNTASYIEGWQEFRRPKIGIQWYPTIKLSRPCYLPHCIPAKHPTRVGSDGIASDGLITYNAATHHESVTWHYSPRFIRRHFHRDNTRDPWYEPWTWCWSCAWHSLWNNIIKPCAAGSVSLTGLRSSGVMAQKLLDEGAAFIKLVGRASGPEGWGATALQGCIFGIVFHKASP